MTSSQDDSDAEVCSICRHIIYATGSETWTDPNGIAIEVPTSDEAYCIVYDVEGCELVICEQCYLHRGDEIAKFDPQVQREIHHEFGLEYRDGERHLEALVSFVKSFLFEVNADNVGEFAGVLANMERFNDALSLARVASQRGLSGPTLRENAKNWEKRVGGR